MEVVMTEKELSQFGLLDEFSITELEQRLEFEAWCDGNCTCTPTNNSCVPNTNCVPIDSLCGGGGGGGGGGDELPNDNCFYDVQP
jgi:hypothetical protein